MRTLRQTGDTIVEVLIAITIAGAVLVGAYAVATRSSQSIRIAQERAEGTKFASAMVEKLHADPATYAAGPASFCANGTAQLNIASCPSDAPVGSLAYHTLVVRTPTGTGQITYQVTTQWDSIRGGVEKVTFWYRTRV